MFAPAGRERLIISDHPVSRSNPFPYGDVGLSSHGVIVGMPIAPDLSLNLICPTNVARYEALDQAEVDPERRARMLRVRDALRAGLPVELDDGAVASLNRRQLTQSSRFLYSATDDFGWARDMLDTSPRLRSVESHVTLGEMGSGPPPRPGMPNGLQLIVQGPHDHCRLPLDEIDEEGEGISARTKSTEQLALVAADPGMLSVELYEDGWMRQSMREATIERFGDPDAGWFRAVQRDESMRALFARIDAERLKPVER
ncbi:MAG: hypothetical protein ACT4N8_02290 [Sphingosinicella sp.]|uniref:hypothetical protein n=1 Tax=Sphingosinicella sp. TaxID=1917971 RepID=UPI0040378098